MPPPRLPRGCRDCVGKNLLPWFAAHARDLPWRRDRSPYRVWISELMLQQTRVDTVVAYFTRWMERFPDPSSLAKAPLQDVLKLWEGLGYYARARNLHAAARLLDGGPLPVRAAEWRALPGVGPYTAAAIASLAYGEPCAVLDGNVERVLSRLCACADDIRLPSTKVALQRVAERLLPPEQPAAFNEAMMELGATVCTPTRPDCSACPFRTVCRAHRSGTAHRFPVKSPKKTIPTLRVGAALITRAADDCLLVAQRPNRGLLGGMWEFPGGKQEPRESMPACIRRELREELGIRVTVGAFFLNVRHTYSHFHLDMDVYWTRWTGPEPRALECADFRWVPPGELRHLPFGGADRKVLRELAHI